MADNVWLCAIKPLSWNIMKKSHIYGLPESRRNELKNLKIGDYLLIYIYPPTSKVVGLCEITSKPYFGDKDYWGPTSSGSSKYPYRINVKIHANIERNSITLAEAVGYTDSLGRYSIEPYLRGILFLKLPCKLANEVLNLIRAHAPFLHLPT